MKLEYFDRSSPSHKPLVLFYGADADVVRALVARLSSLPRDGIELAKFPGVESVDHCSVLVRPSTREGGIRRTGRNAFTWRLTEDALDHLLGFLEPFMEPSTEEGFQWLEDESEVDFIVSRGRYW